MQKIILSSSDKKILTEHAENEKPNESCAILFGKNETVSEIFLTKNIEESPVNFTISNEQLIEGYKTAEEKNVDVIGIFHSHPNSEAYPSSTDKKFMQSNPVAWIIYSGENKDFRAYRLESEIIEIPIEEK
ncbi:Mov34/MPN/PAD-1 family protein [Candidatus Nitrosopumilus koreensis AR1]|uniref:Mov34/MPN/PAD-1 family protein n=1 Tax=Candidatus Nitrosopumilus koreensis AR1 TaxID=1229908 RepID=K0B4Z7_9ARCH|nr:MULTISPECIES: M67 family metallopeptidase [Nitrosopumilus]AFS81253.1 Mov34/MPN/PAD-1 family protein [Candidatus Nitrosopumilus koreensis AR1]